MATLSITVQNPLIPDLVVMATARLQSWGVNTGGMNNTQIGQKYLEESTRRDYLSFKREQASAAAQAALDEARATATSSVTTAVVTAATDATGITS